MHGGTIASMVDFGGSLAVASMGLFATGVSTDLNGESIYNCVPRCLPNHFPSKADQPTPPPSPLAFSDIH